MDEAEEAKLLKAIKDSTAVEKTVNIDPMTGSLNVREIPDMSGDIIAWVTSEAPVKVLAENTDVRHTFFISHLPVLNCCTGNPAWVVSNFKEVRELLLKRNAIIISAHTHVPSLLQAERDGGKLTQVIVSTVGKNWHPDDKMNVFLSGYDKYLARFNPKKLNTKKYKPSFDDMKTFKVTEFEIYQHGTGYAMLRIAGDQVFIDYYTNASGKPSMSKKLR